MFPIEFLVHELHEDRMREANKIRLSHLVTETLSDRLQRYGAALFGSKPEADDEATTKTFSQN